MKKLTKHHLTATTGSVLKGTLSLFLFISLMLAVSGCSWVKLTPKGEKVQILSSEEVTNCKKIGKTSVSLKDKVIGINRKKEKVKLELDTLGRNHGAEMGGDTIVVASEVVNGEQTFDVYQCEAAMN